MTKGLTGIPSLAYLGVNAGSPPNIKMYDRSPTINDSKNFIIGDLWINKTPIPATSTATNLHDCVELLCIVANTEFEVINSVGNWTIV